MGILPCWMDAHVLLEWLCDRAPFGVAWTAGDDRVELNAEAARIVGLHERSIPLEAWAERIRLVDPAGSNVPEAERPLFQAMRGHAVPRTRMQVLRPDGQRVDVCVEAFPEPTAIVLVEDVTWTLESERTQAQWLGALGHELNGALQHFLTSTQAAQRHVGRDSARAAHYLESAQRQIRHMRRLVQDFVEVSRLNAGLFTAQPEPTPLNLMLAELVELAELADPRHRILPELEDELWVHADLDRVRQIFTNLFSNAAKYSTPGLLRLGAQRQEGRILLWIQDEGPGITPEHQAQLFQRFRRLPSRLDGSGLGLWIARELAQKMGGDLWVQSSEGRYTTFYVALPAAERHPVEQAGQQA